MYYCCSVAYISLRVFDHVIQNARGGWTTRSTVMVAIAPPLEASSAMNMNHFLDEESVPALDVDFLEPPRVGVAESILPAQLLLAGWPIVSLCSYGCHLLPVGSLKARYLPLEASEVPLPRIEHSKASA